MWSSKHVKQLFPKQTNNFTFYIVLNSFSLLLFVKRKIYILWTSSRITICIYFYINIYIYQNLCWLKAEFFNIFIIPNKKLHNKNILYFVLDRKLMSLKERLCIFVVFILIKLIILHTLWSAWAFFIQSSSIQAYFVLFFPCNLTSANQNQDHKDPLQNEQMLLKKSCSQRSSVRK